MTLVTPIKTPAFGSTQPIGTGIVPPWLQNRPLPITPKDKK